MRPLRCALCVSLLLLASSAFADSISVGAIWFFGNTGGTLTFNPATQTLTLTSTITTIIAPTNINDPTKGIFTGDFGTISVTVGPLISGSILTHASFDGGTITITSNGTDGLPDGVLFQGTLFNGLFWYRLPNSDEFHLGGMDIGRGILMGPTFGEATFPISDFEQLVVLTGANQFNVLKGDTVIPEPGTVALFSTGLGLLIFIGVIRHRRSA